MIHYHYQLQVQLIQEYVKEHLEINLSIINNTLTENDMKLMDCEIYQYF